MILLIDNYDSFVHNLGRYFGQLGYDRLVIRHDAITLAEIEALAPKAIVLSPGPCTPREAGISLDVIRHFADKIPILGVCLGHQCIGEVYCGQTIRADKPVHGQSSSVTHNGKGIFANLPSPFTAGRYHSLVVNLPENTELEITARLADGDAVMAVQHQTYPLFGVQFHPESVLTEHGMTLLGNFMKLAEAWHKKRDAA